MSYIYSSLFLGIVRRHVQEGSGAEAARGLRFDTHRFVQYDTLHVFSLVS